MLILYHNQKLRGDMNSYRVHIYEVLNGLSKLGHKIIFDDGQFYSVPGANNPEGKSTTSENRSLWGKIKSLILRGPFRSEIGITWGLINELKVFSQASVTIIRNKPDLIYWRSCIYLSGPLLARIFRLPSIVEVNGIILDEAKFDKHNDRFILRIIDLLEKFNLSNSDKYIVVTPKLKTILSANYGISGDKISVVPNGANVEIFRPLEKDLLKRQFGLNLADNYICFVGELLPWEGVEKLIKSMPLIIKKCPNTKALIVGDGVSHEELVTLTNRLGLDDELIFVGRVPYEEIPKYINVSHICVFFGNNHRCQKIGASPLKLCEYLSCGKPVVAGKFDGLEYLEELGCGKLVNPDDLEEIAGTIYRLLNDPVLMTAMGEKGRKYVLENRSWSSVAKKVADICENAVVEHTSSGQRRIGFEVNSAKQDK